MAETSKARRFTVCTNAIVLVLGLAFVTFGVLLFKMQGELVRGISDAYESGRTAVQGGDKQTDQVQDDINEAYANTLGQLKLDTLGLAIAGLGGLMVLISFLGCCGAKAESRPLLCAYLTFTSLFIVAASAVSGVLLYTAVDLASTHTDPASAACKLAVDAKGPEANAAALKELGSEVYFDCNLAHSYALLQAQLLRANRRLAIPLVGDVASTSYVAFKQLLARDAVVLAVACGAVLLLLCLSACAACVARRQAAGNDGDHYFRETSKPLPASTTVVPQHMV